MFSRYILTFNYTYLFILKLGHIMNARLNILFVT